MNKGIIFSVEKDSLIVLNDLGAYEKIVKKPNTSVGQTIYYFDEDVKKEKKSMLQSWVAVASIFLILIGSWQYHEATKVYSLIMVDINPSIQFVVGKNEIVKEAIPLNKDAEQFDAHRYENLKVEQSVIIFVNDATSKGYLDGESESTIYVSYAGVSNKANNFIRFNELLASAIAEKQLQDSITFVVLETSEAYMRKAKDIHSPVIDYLREHKDGIIHEQLYPGKVNDTIKKDSDEAEKNDVDKNGSDEDQSPSPLGSELKPESEPVSEPNDETGINEDIQNVDESEPESERESENGIEEENEKSDDSETEMEKDADIKIDKASKTEKKYESLDENDNADDLIDDEEASESLKQPSGEDDLDSPEENHSNDNLSETSESNLLDIETSGPSDSDDLQNSNPETSSDETQDTETQDNNEEESTQPSEEYSTSEGSDASRDNDNIKTPDENDKSDDPSEANEGSGEVDGESSESDTDQSSSDSDISDVDSE